MLRHVLTIRKLGREACWLLAQQTIGMRSAKKRSDFMLGRTVVLIFASLSLGERLCVTAAVRQMAGYIVYESPHASWREEICHYQRPILPAFDYFVDCLYSYGLPLSAWDMEKAAPNFPVINTGSPDAHPAHALADIACMLRGSGDLQGVAAAWVGCDNGTLHSLIEATAFFLFALRVSPPPHIDAEPLKSAANHLQTPVSFVESPEDAVKDADYIFAGCSGEAERLAGAHHHGGVEHLRGESGLAAVTRLGGLSPTRAQAHTALGILGK